MAENNNEEILLLKKDVNYAVKLLKNGQINEALKIVEALIKKSPNVPLLYNIRGVCYQTIRELGNAIDDFSQATILKSDYAEAYCNLGVTYQEKGDLVSAVNAYKNAIDNDNNYPTAHNNLGKIFDDEQVSAILSKCLDQDAIESMSVLDFQELFTVEENSF